jgi:hypothetical protein
MNATLWRLAGAGICLLSLSCISDTANLPQVDAQAFVFNGKPVHPACVQALNIELADLLPIYAAVDIEGLCKSNQFVDRPISIHDGYLRAVTDDHTGAYFEYRCIGVVRGNEFALDTYEYTGGTGIFRTLMFVRLVNDQVWENGKTRTRTQLLSCGYYNLGDHDNRRIEVRGGFVLVDGTAVYPNP